MENILSQSPAVIPWWNTQEALLSFLLIFVTTIGVFSI